MTTDDVSRVTARAIAIGAAAIEADDSPAASSVGAVRSIDATVTNELALAAMRAVIGAEACAPAPSITNGNANAPPHRNATTLNIDRGPTWAIALAVRTTE
ncbi:MAG: hypothetical protein U0572_18075 [Phycisphaerales bacterium]